MPKLFLHVGVQKTGTTTIQKYLVQNLHADRLRVLPVGLKNGAHHGIPKAILGMDRPNRKRKHDLGALREDIADYGRRPGNDVVASSELLSTERFLANEGLPKLRSLFEGWDVQIIIYVRNQIDWIESLYLQRSKAGNYLQDFDTWCAEVRQQKVADFSGMIEQFRKVFGEPNVHVVSYDDHRDDIMAPFETIAGIAVDRSKLKDANVSGSFRSVFALQSIARDTGQGLTRPQGWRLQSIAKQALTDRQKFTLVSPERARDLAAYYKADNDKLLAMTGIDLNRHMRAKELPVFVVSQARIDADKSLLIGALAEQLLGKRAAARIGTKGQPVAKRKLLKEPKVGRPAQRRRLRRQGRAAG